MSGVSKISASRKRLTAKLERFTATERAVVERAVVIAERSHVGQYRGTGEPYVCHPIEVAAILCDWRLDAPTITAAILHDAPEDTDLSLEEVEETFGSEVAALVSAVTKLSSVRIPQTDIPYETEDLRRLLLAMAADIRVVLLKLADRLHNIRTIVGIRAEKRARFARETIEIYAPLADGLGMGEVRAELADRGFEYAYPKEFRELKRRVEASVKKGSRYLAVVRRQVAKALADEGIAAQVDTRTKTLYSLYRKLEDKQRDLDKVYDFYAVRVIVGTVGECYRGMGIVHRTWQPLPHRIKDYIAVPKANGYRSLHTTIFGPQNRLLEVQFRTREMHEEAEHGAERGVTPHAVYAEHRKSGQVTPEQLAIMRRFKSWQEEMGESPEVIQQFKLDLFSDRIFVFTPKGGLHSLPVRSCPIDFAYAVHTEVGHACRGAKVNGRIVPLDTELANGDVVEILRGSVADPKRGWLKSVRTGHARSAIRRFFREQDRDVTVSEGRRLLVDLLKRHRRPTRLPKAEWQRCIAAVPGASAEDDVLAALGEGRVTQTALAKVLGLAIPAVARRGKAPKGPGRFRIVVGPDVTVPTRRAACCKPRPLVPIVGYVTLHKVASIHRQSCGQVGKLPDPSRLVSARWEEA